MKFEFEICVKKFRIGLNITPISLLGGIVEIDAFDIYAQVDFTALSVNPNEIV